MQNESKVRTIDHMSTKHQELTFIGLTNRYNHKIKGLENCLQLGVIFPRTIFVPGERGFTGHQNFPRGIPGEPNLPTNFTTKTEK